MSSGRTPPTDNVNILIVSPIMSESRRTFGWLTPDTALHLGVLIATTAGAFFMLRARSETYDLELTALKLRVAAVEAQSNQQAVAIAQSRVRIDDEERGLEQVRQTNEAIRSLLSEVAGDLKGVKALLQRSDSRGGAAGG